MSISRSVLITGGRGFVGVNLVHRLSRSRSVKVLDNLKRSSPTGWQGSAAVLHQVDILNTDDLAGSFRDIEQVVHLAAYGSVVESITDPAANFTVNVQGTLNVLRASVSAGVRRLVFASTGGALIGDAAPPVNEQSLPKPISPYGASKLCGEAYCHAFSGSYNLETVCLRFGNVYGPHSAHKKGAVTTFIKALMHDEPIVIYGDGSASRDYIHVEDLCSGIQSALEVPLNGNAVFHLASGRETTVLQLAELLRDIARKPRHPIEFRPVRQGEVARNFASCDKAREAMRFEPEWELADGLAATWEWFQQQDDAVLNAEATDS